MKIYVAISLKQDECTLNNCAFKTYEEALTHKLEVEKNSGCDLSIISMDLYNGK